MKWTDSTLNFATNTTTNWSRSCRRLLHPRPQQQPHHRQLHHTPPPCWRQQQNTYTTPAAAAAMMMMTLCSPFVVVPRITVKEKKRPKKKKKKQQQQLLYPPSPLKIINHGTRSIIVLIVSTLMIGTLKNSPENYGFLCFYFFISGFVLGSWGIVKSSRTIIIIYLVVGVRVCARVP